MVNWFIDNQPKAKNLTERMLIKKLAPKNTDLKLAFLNVIIKTKNKENKIKPNSRLLFNLENSETIPYMVGSAVIFVILYIFFHHSRNYNSYYHKYYHDGYNWLF